METSLLLVVVGAVLVYSLVGRALVRWNITGPMTFLVIGAIYFLLVDLTIDSADIRFLAELTLVVVLFHDASTVRLRALRHHPELPLRLLVIGLPLALLFTAGTTWVLLGSLSAAAIWLIAASVTPTDAGLGAATILNPKVPVGIRRGLNVESGVNDGLVTPIVVAAIAVLLPHEEPGSLFDIGILPVLVSVLIAAVFGVGGAKLLDLAAGAGATSERGSRLAMAALPFVVWGCAELLSANGFIAAFLAGILFGASSDTLHNSPRLADLLELGADLLGYVVWFFAGGLIVAVIMGGIKWQWLLLAVLALTVLRIVPVWLSLLGSELIAPERWFIGWFGPRGLATVVFALLAVEELGAGAGPIPDIVGVLMLTVLLSVFAHGLSAGPLAKRLADMESHRQDFHPDAHPRRSRGRLHR